MPCVRKPTFTHVIIISLWLIRHIQCQFSISYLSIPGMEAHDRCNISHVLLFLVSFHVVLCLLWLISSALSSILYVDACVSVSYRLIFFLCNSHKKSNSHIFCQLFWSTSSLWQQLLEMFLKSLKFFLFENHWVKSMKNEAQ